MRTLPKVGSLQEAIQAVIKSNTADHYPPRRFVQIVSNSKSYELLQVCSELICSQNAFSEMYKAMFKHRNLLTLEDFVACYGRDWGFSEEAVEQAKTRSQSFDTLVGHKRYE
jgi:hypothetical protein